MKNLKITTLAIFSFLIISCSSSDDDNSTNDPKDLIVGVWKPIKEVDVCSTGSEQIFDFSSCHQQSRLTFNADGTLLYVEYHLENGDCIISYNQIGLWKINNDKLALTISGETDSPTFFEVTTNILRIGYYDADPYDPCDGGNLPSHYYTEHTRVE